MSPKVGITLDSRGILARIHDFMGFFCIFGLFPVFSTKAAGSSALFPPCPNQNKPKPFQS